MAYEGGEVIDRGAPRARDWPFRRTPAGTRSVSRKATSSTSVIGGAEPVSSSRVSSARQKGASHRRQPTNAGQIRILRPGGEDQLGAVVDRGQLEDQQVPAPGPAEAARRLPDLDPAGQRRLVDGVLLHVPGPERQRDRGAGRPLADDVAGHPVPQLIGRGDRSPDAVDGVRVVARVAQAAQRSPSRTSSPRAMRRRPPGRPPRSAGLVSHRSPPFSIQVIHLIQVIAEGVESFRPRPAIGLEPVIESRQRLRGQPVPPSLGLGPDHDELCVTKV